MASKQKQGRGHLLSGSNGLRKMIDGTTLAESVMSVSEKPKINYDKMKVSGKEMWKILKRVLLQIKLNGIQ